MPANKSKAAGEFEAALSQLVGKECWSVTHAAGSFVLAYIGEKILRDEPIKNDRLSEEQRLYKGEYWLHVLQCAWRIESATKMLASWRDDNSRNGHMMRTLEKLAHQKIASVELSFPSFDLAIHFENGMIWRIFCDMTDEGIKNNELYENYELRTPSKYYNVEGRSHLKIIERTSTE